MRRINSEFQTKYLSQEGQKLSNGDEFGFVEMDDFACYVMADSLDEDPERNSAKIIVECLIRNFVENPSMRKSTLRKYLNHAHKELNKERSGMRLKASVVMVVTDYQKLRFCYTGNSRFYLIRNGRYFIQTKDQSLTQNLIGAEKVPMDQAALHRERNNLYSYLGKRGMPELVFSSILKLENGDVLAQLTRGIWENCSDDELMEIVNASTEPQDILDKAEDAILGKQENVYSIDNYSLAVTFVQNIYQSPKKKVTLKKVLMVAIPILMVVGGIGLGLYLRHRSVKTKEYNLAKYMDSAEEYLRYDNYKKASEEYGEAKKIAVGIKKQKELEEADQYLKLADQIILADEKMISGEYVKAQELYLSAKDLSVRLGNVGKKYIELQLEQTGTYIEVYDWIAVGEAKESYGDLPGAAEAYRQAKEKAAALYDIKSKEEALKKLMAVEEKMAQTEQEAAAAAQAAEKEAQEEKEKQEAEEKEKEEKEKESEAAELQLENEQKANDRKNAIELENQGNELMEKGQYEQAVTFYRTAQSLYRRLEMHDLVNSVSEKIAAAQAGSEAARSLKEKETISNLKESEADSANGADIK